MTNILILNVGSSSLKFSLFSDSQKLVGGKCDRIAGKESYVEIGEDRIDKNLENFEVALDEVMSQLEKRNFKFEAIAHRVVHGGPINNTCLIDEEIEKTIEKFAKFAPLHNPPQLQVIDVCKKYNLNQYAVFDTAFHASMPKVAYDYALPRKVVEEHDIRKYGFHGTSHKSVTTGIKGKTISCHLGNGSSLAVSIDGKCLDTSMGLTPLAGLVMATRSGDIDPGLVIFLQKQGYDVDKLLNKESGFKGFSEYTDILQMLENIEMPEVKAAYDAFIYSIVKYIGSYVAILNGLDNLIFTGGIGEHIGKVRKDVCKNLEFLGIELKDEQDLIGKLGYEVISTDSSKVVVLVKDPEEEEQIAREVLELI